MILKKKKKKPSSKARTSKGTVWLLYLLECGDGSLYTGITNNLDRRFDQHQRGKASRYTRSRLPVKLLYTEPCRNRSQALKREWSVKALSRVEKERLFQKKNAS